MVCVGIALGLFVLTVSFDLHERWHVWADRFAQWWLDEIMMVLALAAGALAWFSYRRWRESRREALRRIETERRLEAEIAIRRETERTLRESEGRLRQASRLAKLGYYVWDAIEDRCLFCSREYARVHGLTAKEFIARASAVDGPYHMTHPDDRDAVRGAMRRLRRGETVEIEYRAVTPSGEINYVREISEPVLDASGRVVQEIGCSQDVTEIRRAEALMVRAMDASPAVFGLFDPDDRLVMCNRRYRSMYETPAVPIVPGIRFEDLVRAFAAELGIGESTEDAEAWIATRLGRRTAPAKSYEYLRGDGDWIEVSDFVLEDGSVFTVGSIVTEKKHTEAQLLQAQKMEAVGQLTGGVAHDFNNLLAVILGNAELLSGRTSEDGRAIQAILRASARGAELTQHLLAFSRRQPLQPRAIDLDRLVSDLSGLLERSLGATIEIETVLEPDLWAATADPGQVENALLNLALNARDAMPDGGRLTIACANARLDTEEVGGAEALAPGDYVMLTVSDTGRGMSAEILQHAFEPFFTTKEVGQGSGLGLAMVYGFARQSGGHATIQSEPGRGTTVRLYLPRADRPSEAAGTTAAEAPIQGGGQVVLIVENDPDVRELAVTMVRNLGYRAVAVAEAAAAWPVLERDGAVDLVLSDVILPGGTSGLDFAEAARRRYPRLKVLIMSGYPMEADKHRGILDAGAVLLSKPFELAQLAKALDDALA